MILVGSSRSRVDRDEDVERIDELGRVLGVLHSVEVAEHSPAEVAVTGDDLKQRDFDIYLAFLTKNHVHRSR